MILSQNFTENAKVTELGEVQYKAGAHRKIEAVQKPFSTVGRAKTSGEALYVLAMCWQCAGEADCKTVKRATPLQSRPLIQ